MGERLCVYRDDREWTAIAQRLKHMPCPHCKVVGALIRHGCFSGSDERNPRRKILRARRVFCSNRQARPGCGRTFSVWLANNLRRLSVSADTLWQFLQVAVTASVLAASQAVGCQRSVRTWQRIWQRFDRAQSKIRTALCGRSPPPETPPRPETKPARQTAAHVLAHLQAAFPDAQCPIAEFQHTMQTFFV